MNIKFLFLMVLPLVLPAQKNIDMSAARDAITYTYSAAKSPYRGSGVLGVDSKKAFASFVNEEIGKNGELIFNEIKFETVNFNNKSAKINLCLYENQNGLPGKNLAGSKILVEVPRKKNQITVNISSLEIDLPKNGYFIGFEWVFSKENIIHGAVTTSNKPYNPAIAGTNVQNSNLYFFDRTWKKAEEQSVNQLDFKVNYVQKSKQE